MTAVADPPVSPWWRRVVTVLRKEIRDHTRDRRSLVLALIYPLFGPILISVLLDVASTSFDARTDRPVVAGVSGYAEVPALLDFLSRQQIQLVAVDDAPRAVVRTGRLPVVIEIPAGAGRRDSFTVRLLVDSSRVASTAAITRVSDAIAAWGRAVARDRLAARGIDPTVIEPVRIERLSVARDANIALFFYRMIAPLLIFMVFLGAVYLAIDTTVGERERGSWEPLLIAPVRRWELLLGKAGAAFVFSLVTVALNLTVFRIALGVVAGNRPGLAAPPELAAFAGLFAVAVPLIALAVMLQITIAGLTRSMKEAQIYLGLLPLLPAFPSMLAAFVPFAADWTVAAVPLLGQMMLFGRLIDGAPLDLGHVLLATAATGLATVLVFMVATRLFERERLFFPG